VLSEMMLNHKSEMLIHGYHGLNQDLLKLKEEMLNFKIKDVGLMVFLLDHLPIMLMLLLLSKC
jgi:hypothetical protein